MSRTVAQWKGRTDDSKAPPRVRQRIYDRDDGKCHFCGQPIQTGQKWALDHKQALINGGENVESNLAPIHVKPCHEVKTGVDVAIKAKVASTRQKHIGASRPKQSIPSPPKPERPAPKPLGGPRRSLFAARSAP